MECGPPRAPQKARCKRRVDGVGQGVAVDWEKLLPPKVFWCCRGGGWWKGLSPGDREEQEDEQRLRELVCERRGVGVRCHDSPHDEAARPSLRPFHTVSE